MWLQITGLFMIVINTMCCIRTGSFVISFNTCKDYVGPNGVLKDKMERSCGKPHLFYFKDAFLVFV